MNASQYTVEYLATLEDDQLEETLGRAVGSLTTDYLVAGRCLLAAERTGLLDRRGLSGPLHLGKLRGMRAQMARESLRVARAVEDLPQMRLAAEAGTVGWTNLR